ncbi:hypothetical protein [Neisseria sp. Ec49-e6-T10]|uniref:hypothetical protein n=1 Tax=Neisseria sp. Ec49-e6-T10 TaxID=3140744 RepID=UPI003EBF357D
MKRKISRWFILLINIFLLASPAFSYEIIQFYHRVVEDVLPNVQALLQAGESATTIDNKLILNVSSERAKVLVPLIQSLDQKQESLIIEVEQGANRRGQNSALGAQVRIDGVDIQNTKVDVNGRIIVDGYANRTNSQNNSQQTLRLLSGTEGYIELNPRQYKEGSLRHQIGFSVRPRVVGQNVVIDLLAQNQGQRVASTIEGQLGQWIDVAGIDQSGTEDKVVLFGYGQRHQTVSSQVRIRITRAPN